MTETTPIYFSALTLENVKCFGGRQVLDLTDKGRPAQWSLLIGENGVGKTTLLECLAWMRPVRDENRDSERTIDSGSLGVSTVLTDEENAVLETLPWNGSRRVKIEATLSFSAGLGPNGVRHMARSTAKKFRVGTQLSFDQQAQLLDWKMLGKAGIPKVDGEFPKPLIVTYGANRYLGVHNSFGVDDIDPGDHGRLSRSTELCDVEEILMGLDYAAKADPAGREVSILEIFKKAIISILPSDQEGEVIKIHPPDVLDTGRPSGVYVNTFTGPVPMSALSLGHRTTAGWVMDLAWRFINRYRESPCPLEEPAVVLIDEIDLHLHPRWQREIIKKLSALFPATQFIATSHSPLIVQVADTANLVLLQKRDGDVEIVQDTAVPRNLRVDQILNSLFGVQGSRNEHIESLFAQRAELADKADRSPEEEDLLRDIRRQIDELPTAQDGSDREAMDLIRQFANRLENGKVTGL